jgi:hypothetical protein
MEPGAVARAQPGIPIPPVTERFERSGKSRGACSYFWTDQHGIWIQALGRPAGADEVRLAHCSLDSQSFVAVYSTTGRIVGAVGMDSAASLSRCRPYIAQMAPVPASLSLLETRP